MSRVRCAAGALVATLLLVGCGGGGSSPDVASLTGAGSPASHGPTTTAGTATVTELYDRWAQCMRQHGVQMSDPTIDSQGQVSINATGVDQATFQAANQACQSLQQAAQKANGGGAAGPKPDPAQLLKFSECMRAHGLADFPDPSASGGIQISSSPGSDLSPDNPTFQTAQQACQSIMGSPKGAMRVTMSGPPGGGSGGVVSSGAVGGGAG
jgi:hypothetical protein